MKETAVAVETIHNIKNLIDGLLVFMRYLHQKIKLYVTDGMNGKKVVCTACVLLGLLGSC